MLDPIVFEPGKHDRWSLQEIGPRVRAVQVAIHPVTGKVLKSRGLRIPDPLAIDGLVDTGSDSCVVKRELAEQLQLQMLDMVSVTGVQGRTQEVPQYYARILLPNGYQQDTLIIGADLTGAYKLILGRNLLRKCRFTYDGPAGGFRMDFPARPK